MINPSERSNTLGAIEPSSPSLDSLPTEEFLRIVGLRVRSQRSTMSMSRKRLAEVSGVSERYLAQLESGQGNMSIALLRKVTTAIGMSLATLLSAETPELIAATDKASNSFKGSHSQSSISDGGPRKVFGREELLQGKSQLLGEPELQ